jgi:hypothetical protein
MGLLASEAQANTSGAMHMGWERCRHSELMFGCGSTPVKEGLGDCG